MGESLLDFHARLQEHLRSFILEKTDSICVNHLKENQHNFKTYINMLHVCNKDPLEAMKINKQKNSQEIIIK